MLYTNFSFSVTSDIRFIVIIFVIVLRFQFLIVVIVTFVYLLISTIETGYRRRVGS